MDLPRPADRPPRLDAGFEEFVSAESHSLLRSAYLLTGNRADAEDLLQIALMRTLRHWTAISGPPAGYAFAVLVNLSRDRHRARLRRPALGTPPEIPDPLASGHVDRFLERDALTRAAHGLPRTQQAVLACRFLLDLSVVDTAAALRIPAGTVKSHTARALARLRAALANDRVTTRHRSHGAHDVD